MRLSNTLTEQSVKPPCQHLRAHGIRSSDWASTLSGPHCQTRDPQQMMHSSPVSRLEQSWRLHCVVYSLLYVVAVLDSESKVQGQRPMLPVALQAL